MCFFFNDTATTEIYTLSLHDALPIFLTLGVHQEVARRLGRTGDLVARERDSGARALALVAEDHLLHVYGGPPVVGDVIEDRKSTRLNSSYAHISYAVFCL